MKSTSVAGKELATMSASVIAEVNVKLETWLKTVKNKEVLRMAGKIRRHVGRTYAKATKKQCA